MLCGMTGIIELAMSYLKVMGKEHFSSEVFQLGEFVFVRKLGNH